MKTVKKKDKKEILDQITRCPECGSTHLVRDYEHGELVCEDCGLVIDETYVDQGPEWRAFDAAQREERERTGAPMTYTIHDKGLSTEISWKNRDSYGRPVPTRTRAQLYRLRKWHRRIKVSSSADRNIADALQIMERMAANLDLPKDVRETAALIYRKAVRENMVRGRSIESVVAATLYAACRQLKIPRTLDEIASVSRVSKKDIGRTYRLLSRTLGLGISPSEPEDYIERFCSRLRLSGEVKKKAYAILRRAKELGVGRGKGPTGVAAAAIYIAALQVGERRTQREIAEVAGVTEVTIRNRYKELVDKLGIEVEV